MANSIQRVFYPKKKAYKVLLTHPTRFGYRETLHSALVENMEIIGTHGNNRELRDVKMVTEQNMLARTGSEQVANGIYV